MKYIATYDGNYGEGDTLSKAYEDLQLVTNPQEDFISVEFYEVTKIKVIQELKVVPTLTKASPKTTKE